MANVVVALEHMRRKIVKMKVTLTGVRGALIYEQDKEITRSAQNHLSKVMRQIKELDKIFQRREDRIKKKTLD
jgi:ferritin-like metal-binding protein YciE